MQGIHTILLLRIYCIKRLGIPTNHLCSCLKHLLLLIGQLLLIVAIFLILLPLPETNFSETWRTLPFLLSDVLKLRRELFESLQTSVLPLGDLLVLLPDVFLGLNE